MNLPNQFIRSSFDDRSQLLQVNLTDLQALQHFAQVGEQRKLRDESFRKEVLQPFSSEQVGNFAEPLSPLRERDIFALGKLFHRSDMYSIEADVNQMLLHLLPEPCWEEDVFDFLKEFL